MIDNLIVRNVASLTPCPKVPDSKHMTILDEGQVRSLLAHIEAETLGGIFGLSVLTGMREGEYLALQWPDIDFNSTPPVLHVRRTQTMVNKQVVLEPPKTKAGIRTIPLPDEAVDILRAQQAKMLKAGHIRKKFVFVDSNGEMLVRSREVRSCLRRLIKAAGIPRITPHDLRHTHATLCLRAGVNPKVVSERLGHSDVRITLRIYSHVLPDTQADVIPKLKRLLG